MDDVEQYKLSLIKSLEGVIEDIGHAPGEVLHLGLLSTGIRFAIEAIKRGLGEPIDYSSDLDRLIEKDKQ